jgi:hypothetical protein
MILDDGSYDGFIIDVRENEEISRAMHIEVAITSGARKGELITVRATNMQRDAIALMGMPVTLRVVDGQPQLTIDD